MPHLKGFGLENFRVFKEYTWFDFAPITILTGQNNSGKSSLIKALLLMKDNYEKNILELSWEGFLKEKHLKFDNPIHELGGGKTSKNDSSDSDILSFTFTVPNDIFKNQVYLSYSFINQNNIILRFSFAELRDNHKSLIFKFTKKSIYLDLPLILKYLPEDFWNIKDKGDGISIEIETNTNYMEWFDSLLIEHIGHYDFYIFYLEGFRNKIKENEKYILNYWKKEIFFEDFHNEDKKLDFSTFANILNLLFSFNGMELDVEDDNWIKQNYYFNNLDLRDEGRDELFSYKLTHNEQFLRTIFGILNIFPFNANENDLTYNLSFLKNIEYLPTLKGKIERSFRLNDNNLLNILIKESTELISIREEFINKWIKAFGINEIKLEIDESRGISSIRYKRKNLADLGFGISQITAIILKIILSKNKTLILEEPEAHLHPNFQSKLADMLIDAAQTFNIQFIVETHSEYMIRKFQYLVAKGEMKKEDIVIYYFNDPTNVPEGEKQVKKIEILEDGSLSDDFGAGFFDEATNWKFELLRLKKSQKN